MMKRGQGLSTSAIILIILGVVILAVLVIGFSVGWGKVAPYVSKSNVDSIVTQCSTACTEGAGGTYDFCLRGRDLNDGTKTLKSVTCNYLVKNASTDYGVASCPAVTCDSIVFSSVTILADFTSAKVCTSSNKGKTVQALINDQLQTLSCP